MKPEPNLELFTADALGIDRQVIRDYLTFWENTDKTVSQNAQGVIAIAIIEHIKVKLRGRDSFTWYVDARTELIVVDFNQIKVK